MIRVSDHSDVKRGLQVWFVERREHRSGEDRLQLGGNHVAVDHNKDPWLDVRTLNTHLYNFLVTR